ncbi:histidine kinase A domain protein [Enterococcus faecalis 13-SD-W-01]|nr:histidine kinase A domain protein [Enterococcus faecalis 13-SD-W-01]
MIYFLIFLLFLLLFYVILLKRQIKKLNTKMLELPKNARFGQRLSLDFREKNLLHLVDSINQMVNDFETENHDVRAMEENVRLSIAGLSHDLRTPLTAINGYVQLLARTEDTKKRQEYLQIIAQSTDRLLEMTNQFYDLARIETQQRELTIEKLNLPLMVEENLFSFYEAFEQAGINVSFTEQPTELYVYADKLMLTRVLQNIIQNLLRYAKDNAEIHYQQKNGAVTLVIRNNLKADNKLRIEKVFERFYTESSARSNAEASGLGLYLSKKLIQSMNGTMNAALDNNWFAIEVTFQNSHPQMNSNK